MHAMQEHLITDPLGAASRFLAHTHPLCLVLISDLYLCSCWPSHIQTTVLDSCTLLDSPRLSQALPGSPRPSQTSMLPQQGVLDHRLNYRKPCSLSNGEVFSSPLPRRSETPASPEIHDCGNLQEARRLADQPSTNPEVIGQSWVHWPDWTRCPPFCSLCCICTVKPE